MTPEFKKRTLLKIRREFNEKEKYNILMEEYFNLIKKTMYLENLKKKYNDLKLQHKHLQSKYTKLNNETKRKG